MKKILCFILMVIGVCCCISCTCNELSYGFSLKNFKTNTGMYLGIKAYENQEDIKLKIYYGNDFYNDDDFLSVPDCRENTYAISIRFIYGKDEKIIFSKNLDDFSHLDYDCVFNGKLVYEKMFSYSIPKNELEQDGLIQITLTSLSLSSDSFCEIYQKIKYINGGKILIES